MVVRVVTLVNGEDVSNAVFPKTNVVEVVNSNKVLATGSESVAIEVVRPGGTVANVAYGNTLPPAPVEGQIFILVT